MRSRLEGRNVRGTDICICGKTYNAQGHNRQQCLFWLKHDPAPGRGRPVLWMIPDRLHDAKEPAGLSRDMERYLDFWRGRYQRAIDALANRFPHHYMAYRAMVHDGESAIEVAAWMETTPATVRQWKRRGLEFIRTRVGDSLDWEENPVGGLERHKMTDADWKAETARLITQNAELKNRQREGAAA